MTNITFKSFWLSCMVTLVIFSFGALGSNKLHAKNLTKKVQIVYFSSGSYERSGELSWVEKRKNGQTAFYFEQQNITDTAILLFDPSRQVHISLIIADNEILYSHKGEQFRKLYNITNVIRKTNNKNPPLKCGKNYKLVKGNCVLRQNCGANAYRNVEGDCHCNKGFQHSSQGCVAKKVINKHFCGKNHDYINGKCVWKTDKNGFEIAPWLKPQCKELNRLCKRGVNKACMQYEGECQVN